MSNDLDINMPDTVTPEPMTDSELVVSGNATPFATATPQAFDPNATLTITPENRHNAKTVLALGIQLTILSANATESPADRKRAAAFAPILTTIASAVVAETSKVLRVVMEENFTEADATKQIKEATMAFEALLLQAKRAAVYQHQTKAYAKDSQPR